MNDTTTIKLNDEYTTIVNSDTFERLRLDRFKWRPQVHKRAGKVYAVAYCGTMISLHRLITGAVKGQFVDHINGNGLDNRDENIRIATSRQNRANSQANRDNKSGFKGVTWARTSRKWMAQIVNEGQKYYLGVFAHAKRAALAHDRAALALHGEFAGLNFPELRESLRPRDPRT